MAQEGIRKTTRIDRARQRLVGAVERLETALAGAGVEELRAEASALKTENATLRGAVGEVSNRLDSTISRLRATLKD